MMMRVGVRVRVAMTMRMPMAVLMRMGVGMGMGMGMGMGVGMDVGRLFRMGVAVVALLAGARRGTDVGQRLVHDLLDGPGAATALPAAAEAPIDLTCGQGSFRGQNGAADFGVGKDIARTDNHKVTLFPRVSGDAVETHMQLVIARCKTKSRVLKLFQTTGGVLIFLKGAVLLRVRT